MQHCREFGTQLLGCFSSLVLLALLEIRYMPPKSSPQDLEVVELLHGDCVTPNSPPAV